MATLIEAQGSDINQGECRGVTPLILAAGEGNQGTVSLILAQDDANPNKPDNYGGTPLCRASCHGNDGVVRLLLARDDVNPEEPPPKTFRIRRYKQIMAQDIARLRGKRETRLKNGYTIPFGACARDITMTLYFFRDFHLPAVYTLLIGVVMDTV